MNPKIRIFYDNLMAILTGNFAEGETELNDLCDLALVRIDRHFETPPPSIAPKLSAEEVRRIRGFYRKYISFLSPRFHQLYTGVSGGRFSVRYLPEDFYLTTVDPYFTDRLCSKLEDNKCLYYSVYREIKQPEFLMMKKDGLWQDADGKALSDEEMKELLKKENQAVLKRAVCSEGGAGVYFLSGEHLYEQLMEQMADIPCDVVLQKKLRQHPLMSALHPESVNTIRLLSLYTDGQVRIYSAAVRIGVGESHTDNGMTGGIYVGLHSDGRLKKMGCTSKMQTMETHPDLGYRFEGHQIPSFDKVKELVKKAHKMTGHFRLTSWDVAVDESGEAVLIEPNYSMGGINELQIVNGPLFGSDTEKILDEVFAQRRKRLTVFL